MNASATSRTHLDRLVLEWFVRIVHVFERDPVELAFIYVGDAVILATLRTATRSLQVVLEPVRGKPVKNNTYLVPENKTLHTRTITAI